MSTFRSIPACIYIKTNINPQKSNCDFIWVFNGIHMNILNGLFNIPAS